MPLLRTRRLAPKELLFRQNDPGDCVYVLTRGSITVSSAGDDQHLVQRYVSFSPGMMLGETAMLDGQGRTADAIADAESVVHALSRDALERLQDDDPALAARLLRNIALHLSERLRHAAAAWRAAG
jgi:SulP family sulfate permease